MMMNVDWQKGICSSLNWSDLLPIGFIKDEVFEVIIVCPARACVTYLQSKMSRAISDAKFDVLFSLQAYAFYPAGERL